MKNINVTPEQKRMVLYIILTALSLILSALGLLPEDTTIVIPTQAPPDVYVEPVVELLPAQNPAGAMSFGLTGSAGDFGDITAEGITVSGAAEFQSTVSTGALSPDSMTVTGASDLQGTISSSVGGVTMTDDVQITGTLTLADADFTGAVVAVSGTVSDNVTLAHTISTTPTYAVCGVHNSGTLTTSVYVSAIDSTNLTIQAFDADGNAYASDFVVDCLIVP